ncbi:MAG: hypothetical protein KC766_03220, partial [Myxococcales bacterium]|nr:hypothetical protein [Myxococcales bacterium]
MSPVAEAPAALPRRLPCLDPEFAKQSVAYSGASEREMWACYGEPWGDAAACAFWDAHGDIIRTETYHKVPGVLRSGTALQPQADPTLSVRANGNQLELCDESRRSCDAFTTQFPVMDPAGVAAARSPDGNRALLLSPVDSKGIGKYQVQATLLEYPAPTATQAGVLQHSAVSTHAFEGFGLWSALWPGRFAILAALRCCGPDGVTLLVDPETAGWRVLHGYRGSVTPLGGSEYLVIDDKRVSFLDIDTGELTPGPTLPGTLPDDPTAVLAAAIRPARSATFLAVAFPPALIRLEHRRVARLQGV